MAAKIAEVNSQLSVVKSRQEGLVTSVEQARGIAAEATRKGEESRKETEKRFEGQDARSKEAFANLQQRMVGINSSSREGTESSGTGTRGTRKRS